MKNPSHSTCVRAFLILYTYGYIWLNLYIYIYIYIYLLLFTSSCRNAAPLNRGRYNGRSWYNGVSSATSQMNSCGPVFILAEAADVFIPSFLKWFHYESPLLPVASNSPLRPITSVGTMGPPIRPSSSSVATPKVLRARRLLWQFYEPLHCGTNKRCSISRAMILSLSGITDEHIMPEQLQAVAEPTLSAVLYSPAYCIYK